MNRKIFAFLTVMGIVALSCNAPTVSPSQTDIMTQAALTVQAALITPLASPAPENLPLASPPAGALSTPDSSLPAQITVSEVVNCRKGPSTNYERVTQIQPGQVVSIVGSYPPNYWVVNSQAGECWMAVEFSTPIGNYQSVPTVTAPSTPEGGAPTAPTFKKNGWTFYCYGPGKADITLSWNDKSNNETGYRVIRNGEIVADLPADSTYFAETIDLSSGQSVTYEIEAYNEIGSARVSTTIACP